MPREASHKPRAGDARERILAKWLDACLYRNNCAKCEFNFENGDSCCELAESISQDAEKRRQSSKKWHGKKKEVRRGILSSKPSEQKKRRRQAKA